MDLQELSYFTHVKYCLERKESAQIKIRRWYQFLKRKPNIRVYVYKGANNIKLVYKYNINEAGVFFSSDEDKTECVFNNRKEQREYLLRLILRAKICYFINEEFCDGIFIITY
jgi:hypothetical protein